MKLIRMLEMMHVLSMFFLLAASVSITKDKKKKKADKKKKDHNAYALVPMYLIIALLMSIFIAWALWRMIHNRGSWKIHSPQPRPHYVRTPFGWVDQGTWELKQEELAERKDTKRDQHKIYRSSKANYKWIFHDPTGELQQRFDDQKKRSYLRLLPSWMRSYPHGTLQLGISAEQGKAPHGIHQYPEFQSSTHSRLTISEHLEHAQLNGYPMSGALRDPYRLPELPIVKYPDAVECPDAIKAGGSVKSDLLSKLPTMEQPDVIQIWRVQLTPLPERTGRLRLESEEELDGAVEPQEAVIERETRHRLRTGRPQEAMNELGMDLTDAMGLPLSPLPRSFAQNSPAFSRPPVRDHPDPEALLPLLRRGRYIVHLQLSIQDVRTNPELLLVYGIFNNLMQEARRAEGTRSRQAPVVSLPPIRDLPMPVPYNVRWANRLQWYIVDLERQIHELRTEPPLIPNRGRLDSLIQELRRARATRERLVPTASLAPAIPNAQAHLQNHQINQLSAPVHITAPVLQPRLRVMRLMPAIRRVGTTMQAADRVEALHIVDTLHRLITENLQNYLRGLQNHLHDLDTQTFTENMDVFHRLFQSLATTRADLVLASPITQRSLRSIQNVNTSTPTIVTPQTHREGLCAVIEGPVTGGNADLDPTSEEEGHGEANHAVFAGSAMDGSTSSNPISEEDGDGGGDPAVIEGATMDGTSSPNISEEGIQPDTQHPIAIALLRSTPDHGATTDQVDPAAQRHIDYEENTRAAAFYTGMGRSDPAPNARAQGVQTDNDVSPINTLHGPSTSPATLVTVTATLRSQELENAIDEALYTDAYP